MEIEAGAALNTNELIAQVSSFSELVPFRPPQEAGCLFRMEQIVGVEGDIRPGQKPFPHPFPARMPIEVAYAAIKSLTKPGDIVLDPMAGSGVVPRAALDLGRRGIGTDIDPLAIIQSRALCARIPIKRFDAIAEDSYSEASKILRAGHAVRARWRSLDDEDRSFIKYWFRKEHADELFAISIGIDHVATREEWPILATLFSSLIISRGSGASLAMDLSRSRPHRVDIKVPKSPFAAWSQKVAAFRRYYQDRKAQTKADLKVGDARKLRIVDQSVDAIITSPPYLNAIDYMRTSKFSLVFLGRHLRDLRDIRATSIGTEVGLAPGKLETALEVLVEKNVDPTRRPMLRRYIYDLNAVLRESFRVLKPGGMALFVMGPSILSRHEHDASGVLNRLAEGVGFRLIGRGRREFRETRRSLPPPRHDRGESINKRMSWEVYVALVKDLK